MNGGDDGNTSIGLLPTAGKPKIKQSTKNRKKLGVNVADARDRFQASVDKRYHAGGDDLEERARTSGLAPEKKQAILDLFAEMREMKDNDPRRKAIDRATRNLANLVAVIGNEIFSIREELDLPALSA